jgi:UDP-N-acetylmuramyl pentapeptide phosphotransferase/UDP-N-acetylglucosamine-1-phosphate transferase
MPVTARLAALAVAAAVACSLLTLAWIAYARSRNIHDQPGQRRLHRQTTPRGGGIAIVLVLLAALPWLAGGSTGRELLGLAVGIAAFAALGLLDDLLPVPTIGKFAMQLLAAAALVLGIGSGWALGWVGLTVLVLGCVYVVNIWNFMDGSNGMIAVQALLIAIALALWPGQPDYLRLAAAVLAGACAGFLPFNLPGARVFLGDVGSHALGAMVFGLLLLAWQEGGIGLLQCLTLGTVLLVDSGLTLARRAFRGKAVWRAHREHLYQYAVRRGYSHTRVCLAYGAGTALMILLSLAGTLSRSSFVIWSSFIFSWFLAAVVYFGLRQRWLRPRMRRGAEA